MYKLKTVTIIDLFTNLRIYNIFGSQTAEIWFPVANHSLETWWLLIYNIDLPVYSVMFPWCPVATNSTNMLGRQCGVWSSIAASHRRCRRQCTGRWINCGRMNTTSTGWWAGSSSATSNICCAIGHHVEIILLPSWWWWWISRSTVIRVTRTVARLCGCRRESCRLLGMWLGCGG